MTICLPSRYATHYVSPLDSVVIVDGAPVVGADRSEKLIGAIIKVAKKEAGINLRTANIEMPTGEDGKSHGHLFVTLESQAEVEAFRRAMHDYPFDKKHTFKVVPFSHVEAYSQLNEEWTEPAKEKWVPRVRYSLYASFSFSCCTRVEKLTLFVFFARRRNTSAIGWPMVEISSCCIEMMTLPSLGTPNQVLPISPSNEP